MTADREMLSELLGYGLSGEERKAFADMLEWLGESTRRKLSEKQRAWAKVLRPPGRIGA